ncbi:AAA family ATPase [Leptolyngbya sp. NK1-12]|uniref:AAA family ATPase n=1 Tax=Leptolyngbya sp. NK1-12 TaxID=2547451 RepID=A0AA96WJV0_9CYAN|nr:AAA family ATPase [Leptolyngbya sp. NK1-12]
MIPPFVKRYVIALERHKWAGLAGFVLVSGISGVVAAMQSPPAESYQARGMLTYSAPPDTFSATGAALQQQGQAVTKEILLSENVLTITTQRLQTQQIPVQPEEILIKARVVIDGPMTEGTTPPAKEKTSSGQGLRVLVSYQDGRRERAVGVTNALMEAMVEQSRQFNTQQLDRIIQNLNQILPKVDRELRQAEQNLQRYVQREGTAIQSAESGNLLQALTSSQQQQRQLRLEIAGIDAQLRSLQSRLGMSPDEAYAASALSADPILADLRVKIYQAEQQQQLLAKTLRPNHPTMVELQNQLDSYETLLQQRVTEVIGGGKVAAPLRASEAIRQASSLDPARQTLATNLINLKTQRDALQQKLANLTRSEQELRQEYSSIPNKQLEQQRLQQQVALKQTFFDQIQARLADARLAQEEAVGSLVVVQPAQAELIPQTGLSSLVILLVGSGVGVLVGAGLVLLLGALDSTFYTVEDVQGALKQEEVPVLGILPLLPDETDWVPVVAEPGSPYLEAYERLRSTVRRIGGGKALKVMLLTSTIGGEGKTVTAYNLAIASARAGKRTLLIEANLRAASQVQAFKLAVDPESLVEPLRYYGNLSDCVRLVPEIENLYVVPSAGPQRHAAAILESSEMRRLLEDARGRFDLVILDTPALNRCNDALLLEPYTDGIALVTRPGYTEEGLLNETVREFVESDQIRFLGAMINAAEIPLQEPLLPADEEEDPEDLPDQERERVPIAS